MKGNLEKWKRFRSLAAHLIHYSILVCIRNDSREIQEFFVASIIVSGMSKDDGRQPQNKEQNWHVKNTQTHCIPEMKFRNEDKVLVESKRWKSVYS